LIAHIGAITTFRRRISFSTLSQKDSPLAPYLIRTLTEVKEITPDWIVNKNTERPHDSLRDLTPHEYLMINTEVGNSKTAWH
jgi:transposase InsO family protein